MADFLHTEHRMPGGTNLVKSDFLESFARRLRRLHISTLIDDVELKARVARARASLIVNPISGLRYGSNTDCATAEKPKAQG